MKVIMLQQYTDEYGVTFEAGWSVEFTDPHGQRLIDQGFATVAPKNTRPTRSAVLLTTCLPASEAPNTGIPIVFNDPDVQRSLDQDIVKMKKGRDDKIHQVKE